jgi:hypothetical protein
MIHQIVLIPLIEPRVVWVKPGWCVFKPSQFTNYDCLGSNVGTFALTVGCRCRLELDTIFKPMFKATIIKI